MSKRTVAGLCGIGIVVVAGFACGSGNPNGQHLPRTSRYGIAMSVTPLSAPFIIAQAKGYFVEQGLLNVTIHEVIGGYRALRAILQGEADIATASDLSAYPQLNSYLFLGKASIGTTFIALDAKTYKNNFVRVLTRHVQ